MSFILRLSALIPGNSITRFRAYSSCRRVYARVHVAQGPHAYEDMAMLESYAKVRMAASQQQTGCGFGAT